MDKVTDGLFIGDESDAGRESRISTACIDTIISLTHTDPDTGDVPRMDFPMRDGPRNQTEVFADAVQTVVARRERGERILIHCSAGASRSPAVAAAALAQLTGMTISQSFDHVLEQCPDIDPHDALVRQAVEVVDSS